jgi:hypothetical protein
MMTMQIVLAVCGVHSRLIQAPLGASGWAAACLPERGGVAGCVVQTMQHKGHFIALLPWGDCFRVVDSLSDVTVTVLPSAVDVLEFVA